MEGTDPRFVIDGKDYPIPTFDSFDMDEAQILYDLSGLTLEDFAIPDEDEDPDAAAELERKMRNPGFIRALMEVAYRRGNQGVTVARVKSVIGRSNLVTAYENWLEGLVDAGPPEEAQKSSLETPDEPTRPDVSTDSSGTDSTNGSAQPDETPDLTGITRSGTSSQQSAPVM